MGKEWLSGVDAQAVRDFCERYGLKFPTNQEDVADLVDAMGNIPEYAYPGGEVDTQDVHPDIAQDIERELLGEWYGLEIVPKNEWGQEPIQVQALAVEVSAYDERVGELMVAQLKEGVVLYETVGEVRVSNDRQLYLFFHEGTGETGQRPEKEYTNRPTKEGRDHRSIVPVIPREAIGDYYYLGDAQASFELAQGRSERVRKLRPMVVFVKESRTEEAGEDVVAESAGDPYDPLFGQPQAEFEAEQQRLADEEKSELGDW